MTSGWVDSRRRQALPPDWPQRRLVVARRARWQCQGAGCPRRGNECDHIKDPNDHTLQNLQWLCTACHRRKTIAERSVRSDRREPERHPGLT